MIAEETFIVRGRSQEPHPYGALRSNGGVATVTRGVGSVRWAHTGERCDRDRRLRRRVTDHITISSGTALVPGLTLTS